ncbi:MAG: glycosyltransferase family 1 protein [candidate division WOR-3 bacterium]
MRIAVNLIWLKPRAMGGVETFVRYLLLGFQRIGLFNEFIVLTNSKAYDYLKEWGITDVYEIITEDVDPFDVARTFFYQYLNMEKIAKKLNINLLYHPTPIYPVRKIKNVKQVVTFHDLQFLHYPQYATYFQRVKYMWSWRWSLKNADKIVAISNFTRNDIIKSFRVNENKIEVIHNPIVLPEISADFSKLAHRFAIEPKGYFYTISSLLPHKNTETLLKMMNLIKHRDINNIPHKLVISGVGKIQGSIVERTINELGLNHNVIFTGFVTEEEKRSLIENCYCFLFPSLFEGFGMPPLEALILGVPAIVAKISALEETTRGMAIYVDNPTNEEEWLDTILKHHQSFFYWNRDSELKETYSEIRAAQRYYETFLRVLSQG